MAIGPGAAAKAAGVADQGRRRLGSINEDRKDRGAASETVASLTGGRANASKSSSTTVERQVL